MKAATLPIYGSPKNIEIKDIPKPTVKPNEVLVKVMASTINDYDWIITSGKPFILRVMLGLSKPRNPILGMELSGIIEEVGSEVTKFKIGDRVFADTSDDRFGTLAEYIALNEKTLTILPDHISFIEGASIPHAGLLAYQGLVELGGISNGMNVLVNGAGGGVGSFALYICKHFNCQVTGVDTGSKLEKMKAWGYDEVIDYRRTDFTKSGNKYDLILDAKTFKSARKYRNVLSEKGVYVTVGGSLTRLFMILLNQLTINNFSDKKVKVLGLKANKGLDKLIELIGNGAIKFNLDKYKGLESVPKAIEEFGKATHQGKIVIEI